MKIKELMLHENLTCSASTPDRLEPASELVNKLFDFLKTVGKSYDMGTVLIALGSCYHAQAQTILLKKKESDAPTKIPEKL